MEDAAVLAVHKPAGLAVQSRRLGEMDLEHALLNHLAEEGEKPYLAVINRLDQPVEGIVLFAKTKKAAADLSAQMQQDRMEKYYQAIVCGKAKQEDTLTDDLLRDGRTNHSAVVAPGTKGAKKAVLSYRLLQELPEGRSLLKIRLQTGRHHQIRVQLSHAGLPILGDRKYGGEAARAAQHVKLCCCALTFLHPLTKKKIRLTIPGYRDDICDQLS